MHWIWFTLNLLLKLIKQLRKRARFDLCLLFTKYGDHHSGLLANTRNPSRTKLSTSILNISLYTFSTGYILEHKGFISSFN